MSSANTTPTPIPGSAAPSGITASASHLGADPKITRRLTRVKHIILVLSGKGGVGKSSVSAQLALSLSSQPPPEGSTSNSTNGKAKVGILDIDLTGPSIPRMLGLDGENVRQSSDGWVPVFTDAQQNLAVMSVGFLLRSKNDSVVWRGPKKNAMIKQFLGDVRWGDLDYLIIDTPPGTSDEHISALEYLNGFHPSAVMVTTPQAVSLADNLRSLDFTRKTGLPVLGLIENMSGYMCPHCQECTNVWGKGGGEALAQREGIRFLGRIPIDPGLVRLLDDAREEAVRKEAGEVTKASDDSSNPRIEGEDQEGAKEGRAAKKEEEEDVSATIPTATTGTALSRTTVQRYFDSQTFPIFQSITEKIKEEVERFKQQLQAPR
ncbi:P-loop containing nucleoside triphosphate hydrolase protein [Violaceomyces palustris]|uniref:P-loop containing nucleoside triphosphate hydrolase protein n=1 Tax=Violaceomyces palustris TaxID=1673888 RepID=A0ACD0P845_9BASI|nr:P-loop containing nucleoside triphosphate hydrolase protein [Violaceomyces palustris]